MAKVILIVLDGVGIGEAPDAELFGDKGTNTLAHIAEKVGGLNLPNLEKLGLGNIHHIEGIAKVPNAIGSFGKMKEVSKGKDTTSGHWELAGFSLDKQFPMFNQGFPKEIIDRFLELNGLEGILGNYAASGTEIIMQLGEEHMKTGYPIVYTSADSVFQIAAHEEVIPLERLYQICKKTREELFTGDIALGRIIARPFLGTPGNFYRTENRKDYSLDPFKETIFDILTKAGIDTYGVGKIGDIFNYRNIKYIYKTKNNRSGAEKTIELIENIDNGFIMTNLVDFDQNYGHRNDPDGFAKALLEFDNYLSVILEKIKKDDLLIITADHGNDPTTPGTDHTREFVPLLVYGKEYKGGVDLKIRETFADVAKTICDFYSVENNSEGVSFLNLIK